MVDGPAYNMVSSRGLCPTIGNEEAYLNNLFYDFNLKEESILMLFVIPLLYIHTQ